MAGCQWLTVCYSPLAIAVERAHPGFCSSATVTATRSPATMPGLAANRPGAYTCAPFSTDSPARRLITTSRPPGGTQHLKRLARSCYRTKVLIARSLAQAKCKTCFIKALHRITHCRQHSTYFFKPAPTTRRE
eukprot:GHRR01024454.1.p1 GENE.GHRR01024454.1~~GHRR01024454.1.p1  ORF type:complete len:133 (-),score=25.84 GHRR01024454.1:874-1272(-)